MVKLTKTKPTQTTKSNVSIKTGGDVPWDQAIQQVLTGADEALSCQEISRRIIDGDLRTSVGATPAATVASYLSVSLSKVDSPYIRVSRGLYTVRSEFKETLIKSTDATVDEEDLAEAGVLKAFGMYWRRDHVVWSGSSQLLGRQGSGALNVNFAPQTGVYLLHDRERVVYVGQATVNIYARLKTHTGDRLSSRWDRFSWFGLQKVSAEGALVANDAKWSHDIIIETMEALLIECLEPPLNRRQGDNIAAAEFFQVLDPNLEKAQEQAILDKMKKGAGFN